MNILVINTGSSSLKYQLFDMDNDLVLAGGSVERIGDAQGILTHKLMSEGKEQKTTRTQPIQDHREAMHLVAELITQKIDALGHRVVQGGEFFKASAIVNQGVKDAIQENNKLAPVHTSNLLGVQVAEELFPGKPQVVVFDTIFHQTMPEKAYLYALPYEYYKKYKIRKYGFHGTSHKYVTQMAAELMGKESDQINLITLHLGNGCSVSAIKNGQCQDTSMGLTPLAGVMMGTRTGDIDPAIFGYLMDNTGMSHRQVDDVLNKQSGLKGICGQNDLRDIHELAQQGDRLAKLAVEMFTYQIKKYIGAYAAVLGHVDGLVFTAGIGENDEIVRAKALENLSFLGIELDLEKNDIRSNQPRPVHKKSSRVQVWVIPTNEELQIARETCELLKTSK